MTEEKPLDEYEFFNDALKDKVVDNNTPADEPKEYMVSSNHRNLMLISTGVILLNILRFTFGPFFPHITGFSLGQNQALTIVIIGATGFTFYFMLNYFRHYKLNALVQVTWLMLIADIAPNVVYLISTFSIFLPEIIGTIINLLAIVTMIVWVVKVLRLNSMDYSAIKPLKYSAIALIFETFFGFVFGFGLMYLFEFDSGAYKYIGLSYLPIIIYHFFIIKFTLELKVKQEFYI